MEIECCIGDLFEAIARSEGNEFKLNEEYFQTNKLELLNEKNEWCDVPALITKSDATRKITFSNGAVIECAKDHLLHVGANYTKFAKDFREGDQIQLANGKAVYCISNDTLADSETVYDLQIDTPSHLYQTANGVVHHNTLIAQSIARLLNVPFTIADATSLTESGLNTGPFIL